jgi:ABC-type Na+ efflux pump permease subunit/membrane protease YdiL (CAAX protease family)
MRLELVRAVFLKELRETLRDRRSMTVMFGIPLLLYPLMTLGLATLTASTQHRMSQQVSRVAVVNAGAAPHLITQITRPGSEVHIVPARDPKKALAANEIDAVLALPPHCEAEALAARNTEIHVQLDRSRSTSSFTQRKLDRILHDYEEWIIAERLKSRGLPVSLVRPLQSVTDDVATGGQRLGRLFALMLPVLLLTTGLFGAFVPAVNTITAERELGTLETLLVSPARKLELLLAKGALVLLSSLLTAGLNMLSMALVLWRTFSMAERSLGALTVDRGALALAYLAAVPALLFFAAATLVVCLAARSYREASAYATPLFLLPLVPMIVSIVEPKASPGLLVTPIINSTLVIRDVLTGHPSAGAFCLAFASSCLYTGLMLSMAGRLFSTEALVNPAWEPLSTRGLRSNLRRRERRLPAVDEALALYAVSLLLVFYVSPELMNAGFVPLLAGVELLLIAAPTLLFAWLGRYRWVETFAWRRPRGLSLVGAAMIGVGILPWVYTLVNLQSRFWPQDTESARAMLKLLLPSLRQHPVLTVVAVGLLAGVCEELLYRGPLQTALARRLPPWLALSVGAVLFAAAHLDLQGMLFRTLLGVILGWIVLRGGSIFPAMLMHAAIDSTQMALLTRVSHRVGPGVSASDLQLAAQSSRIFTGPAALAAGGALLLLGWVLCRRAFRQAEGKGLSRAAPTRVSTPAAIQHEHEHE